jgi:Phosphatidylglycerophosphate synthase
MIKIPNILSISRIIASILLLFVFDNFTVFFSLYIFAGITDILDGYLARKLKAESAFGAKIDSVADLFFYLVLTAYIAIQHWETVTSFWIFITFILLLRLTSIAIGLYKFRKIVMIHTIGNKVAGFLIFFLPLLLWLKLYETIPVILVIALLTSLEEIFILVVTQKEEIQLDRKSIFCKPNVKYQTDGIGRHNR